MADVAALSIPVDTSGVDKATDSLSKLAGQAEKTEGAAISLTTAVEGLASAWMGMQLLELAKNIFEVSTRYDMLGATMDVMANNAGRYGYELRDMQAQMEKEGISALQARKSLEIMSAAHIELSKSTQLTKVAMNAAAIAGIDVSTAMDNIVRGLASGETRILRHMGLMVNFKQAYKDYQEQVLGSTRALTADEQAQVRMNATLQEGERRQGAMAAAAATTGGQLVFMKAQFTDLQTLLGEAFGDAALVVVKEMGEALRNLITDMKEWFNSGEGQLWANSMAHSFTTVISYVRAFAESIFENIRILEMLGAAYAGVKVAGWLMSWRESIAAWAGVSRLTAAEVVADDVATGTKRISVANATAAGIIKAEAMLAEAQVMHANAARDAYTMEIAQLNTLWKTKEFYAEMELKRTVIADGITAAVARQAVANTALAGSEALVAEGTAAVGAAAAGATPAVTAFDAAVAGLGGWITIVAAAIGALAMWWATSGDSSKGRTDKVVQLADDRIAALHKEIEAYHDAEIEAKRHQDNESGKGPYRSEVTAASAGPLKILIGDIEKLEAEAKIYRDALSDANLYTSEGAEGLAEIEGRIAALQGKRKEMEAATAAVAKIHQEEEQKRIDARKQDEAAAVNEKNLAYLNRIAELKRKEFDYDMQGRGFSKELLTQLKEQADLEAKIEEVRNRMNQKKNPETRAQGTAEITQLTHTATAAQAAAERDAETKAREKAMNDIDDAVAKNTNIIEANRKKIAEAGMTDHEIALQRISDLALLRTYDGDPAVSPERLAMYVEELNNQEAALRKIAEDHKLISEGTAMNKSKETGDNALGHLNDVRDAMAWNNYLEKGPAMLREVYVKEWTAIQEKSNSVMGAMVSGMKSASVAMGNAFATFCETGKFKFKDFMVSVLDSIIKTESTKAFASMFDGVMSFMAPTGVATGMTGIGFSDETMSLASGIGFGGAFASGGFTPGTAPILVGENGPEIFTPGVSGNITPNGAGGGMSSVVNISIDNGGNPTSNTNKTNTAAMAREMENSILQIIFKHQRPGGALNRV